MGDEVTLQQLECPPTIYFNVRQPGGAPKGVKKVGKHEKMATVRASCMYKASHTTPQVQAQIINPLTAADGLTNAMGRMTLVQLEELNGKLNGLTRSSETAICEILAPYITPDVLALTQQIEQMKQQIQNAETQLEAVHSAITVGFAEMYYQGHQYDYTAFYNAVEDRIAQLKEHERNQERERLQRQLATAQAAQQSAMDTENLYSNHHNFRPKFSAS